jgi:hypothetical protein
MDDRTNQMEMAAQEVIQLWMASRPKMVAALTEQGELELVAKQAAMDWVETREELMEEGMHPLEADNLAKREWVILPDLGEDEEETSD